MKTTRTTVLIGLLLLFHYTAKAQWGDPDGGTLNSNKADEIVWETMQMNMGEVKHQQPKTAIFKFTNKGGKPVIITAAKGSCGCTKIDYSKKPVLPGKSSDVKVVFDAEDLGVFNKTVTLTMNIEKSTQILKLKGVVVK